MVLIDDESCWFGAADVLPTCSTIRDSTSAMKMVDDDDKSSLRRSEGPQLFEGIAA